MASAAIDLVGFTLKRPVDRSRLGALTHYHVLARRNKQARDFLPSQVAIADKTQDRHDQCPANEHKHLNETHHFHRRRSDIRTCYLACRNLGTRLRLRQRFKIRRLDRRHFHLHLDIRN